MYAGMTFFLLSCRSSDCYCAHGTHNRRCEDWNRTAEASLLRSLLWQPYRPCCMSLAHLCAVLSYADSVHHYFVYLSFMCSCADSYPSRVQWKKSECGLEFMNYEGVFWIIAYFLFFLCYPIV
jgi:hypothetical protein